ncbi:uncharacterized protein JCM15063_003599 [Sporobolomyces koalae]|uniref:uncharacterized protein n=1 Tax=Sporobolomyces koalae TaxID=500713 RepID=UPI00316C3C76
MLSLRSTAPRTLLSTVAPRRSLSVAAHALRTGSGSPLLARLSPSTSLASPLANKMGAVRNSHGMGESTVRPESDKVMQDIADYVHNYQIDSDVAYSTARLCLIDTIGCGLEGLRVSDECRALMEPIVPDTVVPNGTKIPGTPYQLDPVRGAFAIGTQIRWLDFNE